MEDIEVVVYDVDYVPDYREAEEERQANELVRISNEEGRVAAEGLRVTAEQGRVDAEALRVSAEGGRVLAEEGRVDAEADRVLAEQGRVAAEDDRVLAEQTREAVIDSLSDVATSGSYTDLSNTPTNVSDFYNDSGFIDKTVNNLTNYTLATGTGSTIDLSINSSTYVVSLALKNAAGTTISSGSIDLPLESVVVSGSYDSANKKVVLTLQSGSTIEFSVADLVAGLQTEITSTNKLNSDYVDDTGHTNKFVTSSDKTNWNAKEDASNKVTTLTNTSTDTQYPSAKCVYDLIGNLEDILEELDIGEGI